MAYDPNMPTLVLLFPQAPRRLAVSEFQVVVGDLNAVYELSVLLQEPGYEYAHIPAWVMPRRRSRLAPSDRAFVGTLSYGSPFEFGLQVLGTTWPILREIPSILAGGQAIDDMLNEASIRRRERAASADLLEQEAERVRLQNELTRLDLERLLKMREREVAAARRPVAPLHFSSDVVLGGDDDGVLEPYMQEDPNRPEADVTPILQVSDRVRDRLGAVRASEYEPGELPSHLRD